MDPASLSRPGLRLRIGNSVGVNWWPSGRGGGASPAFGISLGASPKVGGVTDGVDLPSEDTESVTFGAAAGAGRAPKLVAGGVALRLPGCANEGPNS